MTATLLPAHPVARVWGRDTLPPPFADHAGRGERIGEIWFEDEGGDLLVKRLFTSEKLSVQVHPDDAAARARGHARGKDEAWIVTDVEPGATIGIGLKAPVDADTLRAAALDGRIEAMLDWRPVKPGDVYYAPAGTIHAIGPGVSLIEIQQNCDVTYRLYDYGRPRELHLEDGIAVADPAPYTPPAGAAKLGQDREILASGGAFVLERWAKANGTIQPPDDRPLTLVIAKGRGTLGKTPYQPGQVWRVDSETPIAAEPGSELFAAYPGDAVRDTLRA